MPKYRVVHGTLRLKSGSYRGDKKTPGKGDEIELSEAEADSLPAGVVETLGGNPVGAPVAIGLPENKRHRDGTILTVDEKPIGVVRPGKAKAP